MGQSQAKLADGALRPIIPPIPIPQVPASHAFLMFNIGNMSLEDVTLSLITS